MRINTFLKQKLLFAYTILEPNFYILYCACKFRNKIVFKLNFTAQFL